MDVLLTLKRFARLIVSSKNTLVTTSNKSQLREKSKKPSDQRERALLSLRPVVKLYICHLQFVWITKRIKLV
jgi:hypothetical protein